MMRRSKRGQMTAEVAVLFSFVVAALVAMGFYIQRGAQGSVKSNTDSIGQQFSPKHAWHSRSGSKQHQVSNEVKSTYCSEYEHAPGKTSALTTTADKCKDTAVGDPDTTFPDRVTVPDIL